MAKEKAPKRRAKLPKRQAPVDRKRQKTARRRVSVHPDPPAKPPLTASEIIPPKRLITLASIAEMRRGGNLRSVSGKEYGLTGTRNVLGHIVNEDYNPLFVPAMGMAIFDQMERSDAQAGAAVDVVRLPIQAATFEAVPPRDPTPDEIAIADACNRWIFDSGAMLDPWPEVLRHLLLKVHMGFSLVEKVWTWEESEGIYRFARLAPRMPRSVEKFNVDRYGRLESVEQNTVIPGSGEMATPIMPADVVALTVRNKEGDNFWGRSVLRRAYKHWWYKDEAYRIDGVRLDRFGVGIPVAKIEGDYPIEADELAEIEATLVAMRSHERAYVIETGGVTFRIMTPENGFGGASGLMESVKHHDGMILRSVLATFMSDHAEGLNSNRTKTLAELFLNSLKGEAYGVASTLDRQIIRQFCDFNFDMTKHRYPGVKISGLGDLSLEQLKEIIPAFANAKVLTPTDTDEDRIRILLGMDPLPEGWKRGEEKPALPTPDPGAPTPDQITDNPDAQE